jgi:hypothetical protein
VKQVKLKNIERGKYMHCYLCFVEQRGYQHCAHALCQRCGAGICAEHVVALNVRPVCGMAGCSGPERKMLCSKCYTALYQPKPLASQPQKKSRLVAPRQWWQIIKEAGWLRRKSIAELPTPEEAIAEAELWLKKQYEH